MSAEINTTVEPTGDWYPSVGVYPSNFYNYQHSGYITINDAPVAAFELDKGIVWIDKEINEDALADFHQHLAWAAAKNSKVTVTICSPGGDVFVGLAIYDLIRYYSKGYNIPIDTLGLGYMASMASIIFQAGTERLIGPNSWYLIHKISDTKINATTDSLEDAVDLNKRIEQKAIKTYCERSKLTPELVEVNWKRKDWWLDAEDMISLGLADKIIKV